MCLRHGVAKRQWRLFGGGKPVKNPVFCEEADEKKNLRELPIGLILGDGNGGDRHGRAAKGSNDIAELY